MNASQISLKQSHSASRPERQITTGECSTSRRYSVALRVELMGRLCHKAKRLMPQQEK